VLYRELQIMLKQLPKQGLPTNNSISTQVLFSAYSGLILYIYYFSAFTLTYR